MKNNQPNNKPVTGNTLDYYNDDMSRKAVGKLFDDIEELGEEDRLQDTGSIVVNYDDKMPSEREAVYEPEPVKYSSDPAMDRAIERATELATGQTPGVDFDGIERAEAADYDEPAERAGRDRVFAQDYDMSMYRRNKKVLDDDEYEEIMRTSKRARLPEPAVIRRNEPSTQEKPMPPRRRQTALKAEPDEYIEKAAIQRDREEILRAANAHRRTKRLQPYIAGIFIVLMVALALLLVRINALNARLEEAELVQDELNQSIEHYSSVQLTNQALEKEVEELKAELEALRAEPATAQTNGDTGGTGQTATEPVLPTKYVVVEGDNLSKISYRFYGTTSMYEKIMDANGLTSDTVMIGQTLTIPE